jgi:hypothetical protein
MITQEVRVFSSGIFSAEYRSAWTLKESRWQDFPFVSFVIYVVKPY